MQAPSQRRLDLTIGGAQKSGTTTLDAIFRYHPQIQMAKIKETHFFDDDARDWDTPDYAPLHAQFDNAPNKLRGEATPITLYWRPAIRRLHAYNPDIKIILILRNPVTRAFAQWRKAYGEKREPMLFADAIRAYPERVKALGDSIDARHYSYVERGFYGEQLEYLTSVFPKQNVHIEISEEFYGDRDGGLARMAAFLGIAPFPSIPNVHRHASKKINYPSVLGPDDIALLSRLFAADRTRVEAFVGRPIPLWLPENVGAASL